MTGISDKQGQMLVFIENFVAQNGYPPTREEIRTGLNISTKSLVNYHLEALESAALITRIPNTPRGLRLTYQGDTKNGQAGPTMIDKTHTNLPRLDFDEVLELTYGMITNDSNLYALKVVGDTVIDAQVSDGDIVILQRQSRAKNGEMVAVRLIDRDETTLRQYYRENGHVRLQPANPEMGPTIVAPEAVEVKGKVVAIIRQVD